MELGNHDCHSVNWKGVDFDVFVVKDLNYNMIMIPTYSGIMVCGDQKEEYQLSKGKVITCKYAETFAHRYLYIGDLDNHNAMRHYGGTKQKVLLENTWITHG